MLKKHEASQRPPNGLPAKGWEVAGRCPNCQRLIALILMYSAKLKAINAEGIERELRSAARQQLSRAELAAAYEIIHHMHAQQIETIIAVWMTNEMSGT